MKKSMIMKAAAIFALAGLMAFAVAGCGGGSGSGDSSSGGPAPAGPGASVETKTINVEGTDMFDLAITKSEVTQNDKGKNLLIVTAKITNISSEPQDVASFIQADAMRGDDSLRGTFVEGTSVPIKELGTLAPGASADLVTAYELGDDTTSPVTYEFRGFSSATEHVTFEIPLS